MASAHTSHSSGGQAGFGLLLAIAAFAISAFLFWSDAQADTLASTSDPQRVEGLVRLSEISEGALLIETVEPGLYLPAPMLATDMAVEIDSGVPPRSSSNCERITFGVTRMKNS